MAAIDKIEEFYTCAKRFAVLATKGAYRPDQDALDIPQKVHDALDTICLFFSNDPEFLKRAEEAQEWFKEANNEFEMRNRQEMLSQIIKDCCR